MPDAPQNPEPPVTPPASEPGLAGTDLLLTALLGGLACTLLGWLAPQPWVAYYALHLWLPLWLIVCVVFGGPLLAGRGPWLKRALRVTRGQFVEYGGGFYGAVALTCFLHLEWARLQEEWLDLLLDPSVRGIVQNIVQFSIDSIMNGIWAIAWPGFLGKVFDSRGVWPAIVVGYAVFEAGRFLVRHLPRRAAR